MLDIEKTFWSLRAILVPREEVAAPAARRGDAGLHFFRGQLVGIVPPLGPPDSLNRVSMNAVNNDCGTFRTEGCDPGLSWGPIERRGGSLVNLENDAEMLDLSKKMVVTLLSNCAEVKEIVVLGGHSTRPKTDQHINQSKRHPD